MQPIFSAQMDTISKIEPEWTTLLASLKSTSVFLTPEFQTAWWQNFGQGELCIVPIKNETQELLGIASFYFDQGVLRFLGDQQVSDYLDFVVKKDQAESFFDRLVDDLLKNQASWQKIELVSIPQNSPTLHFLVDFAKQAGWQVNVQQQHVCPVITLPKTWEEYLQLVGKKQRHEIKRKWKNVNEKLQPTFKIVETAENLEQDTNDFMRLHRLSSPEKAAFWTEKQVQYFQQVIKTAAEHGWLKLFFLEIEGQRTATMLCFDYHNQFFLYNSGYDPLQFAGLSVGNVLTTHTIQAAIELGRTRYDFLRGGEEYKLRFGAIAEPIFDLTITH